MDLDSLYQPDYVLDNLEFFGDSNGNKLVPVVGGHFLAGGSLGILAKRKRLMTGMKLPTIPSTEVAALGLTALLCADGSQEGDNEVPASFYSATFTTSASNTNKDDHRVPSIQKLSSFSDDGMNDLQDLPISNGVPPLTPSTTQKMSRVITESLMAFQDEQKRFDIPRDPSQWNSDHVCLWLHWFTQNFATGDLQISNFQIDGQQLCAMGRKEFLELCPPFVGDIIWEHLDMMKKEASTEQLCNVLTNYSEPIIDDRFQRSYSNLSDQSMASVSSLGQTYLDGDYNQPDHLPNLNDLSPDGRCSYNSNTSFVRPPNSNSTVASPCSGSNQSGSSFDDGCDTFLLNLNSNGSTGGVNSGSIFEMHARGSNEFYAQQEQKPLCDKTDFLGDSPTSAGPPSHLGQDHFLSNGQHPLQHMPYPKLTGIKMESSWAGPDYTDHCEAYYRSSNGFQADLSPESSPTSDTARPIIPPSLPGSNAGSGPIQLWQFLLEQLTNKTCEDSISWTGDGWEFKLSDPDEVARKWGIRKNKPKMNYEKLSRGLRYYYDKNIIHKTAGKRYVYRFVCDLQGLLGLTPQELFDAYDLKPQKDKDDE